MEAVMGNVPIGLKPERVMKTKTGKTEEKILERKSDEKIQYNWIAVFDSQGNYINGTEIIGRSSIAYLSHYNTAFSMIERKYGQRDDFRIFITSDPLDGLESRVAYVRRINFSNFSKGDEQAAAQKTGEKRGLIQTLLGYFR